MLRWDDPIGFVKGATPVVRGAWEELGAKTIGDLLRFIPRRYDDYSKTVAIKDVQAGDVVTVRGKVLKCVKLPSFRKRFQMFRATIQDETGSLGATFFNQPWVLQEFLPGREVLWSGKVTVHPRFGKSMSNPLWEAPNRVSVAVGKLAPVYPLTGSLTQKRYRRLVQSILETIEFPPESLPEDLRTRLGLIPLEKAIRAVHEPTTMEEAEQGRERLAFDELLTYQLALSLAGREARKAGSIAIPFDERFARKFVEGLSFPLTGDQKRAMWAVIQDLQTGLPMRRLLQGDVGSGKTVVAAFLAAHVQRSGSSAAVLAPTDILARQHATAFRRFLSAYQVPLVLITRTEKHVFLEAEDRTLSPSELIATIQQGNAVFIGTHALLEANRLPEDLALAIVDEQHRFGVEQREAMIVSTRRDGRVPHFLSMTATPIPRSLALVFYGDLAVSNLYEKPVGRLPIPTTVCRGEARETAYQAIRAAVARKEQAFVVCPLIDPSDVLGVRSVTQEWKRLSQGSLKGLRLGMLHGRLKTAEKEGLMQSFLSGELDVLVSTTVIEVGVDIPRATVMAIEGAERFGMAQLHQLRGRVGRSHLPSSCFFLTDAEGPSFERLQTVARIQDGFRLAEEDLKERGSGHLMGKEQSGQPLFHAAKMTDLRLMTAAKEATEMMLGQEGSLARFPEWNARVQLLRETSHLE